MNEDVRERFIVGMGCSLTYQRTGERRPPRKGEWYLSGERVVHRAGRDYIASHPILVVKA
ncbi:MAG: hypothetical protein JWL65_5893 [Gammaproteobacteria bacterium]|nr:hypothetical protein [Gammaproteobacteria bacterium]